MGNTTTSRGGSVALAVRTLRDLGMPWAEIDRILATSDPRVVRRYLDLHIERLEERLGDTRTALIGLEPILVAAISAFDPSHQPKARRPSRSEATSGRSAIAAHR